MTKIENERHVSFTCPAISCCGGRLAKSQTGDLGHPLDEGTSCESSTSTVTKLGERLCQPSYPAALVHAHSGAISRPTRTTHTHDVRYVGTSGIGSIELPCK